MLFSTANGRDNPVIKISLTIFILCLALPAKSQATFYWGIGIRLGWDIGADITLGPNLLVGVVEDVKFYQLSIGAKAPFFKKADYPYQRHIFIDVQVGSYHNIYSERPSWFGGGLGIILYKQNENLKIRPRASIFTGYALLLNFAFGLRLSPGFDLTYINNHTSIANLNVTSAFLFPVEIINTPFD